MKKKFSMLLCAAFLASFALTACGDEHKHSFSSSWSNDATNHWHAATCEHGEEKDDLGAHADANEDGKCDVCDYAVGHEHSFAETWSSDENKHWKAATCTHTDEKAEEGLHADADTNGECDVCEAHVHVVNYAGVCDVCGETIVPMDESKMEMVIGATLAQQKSVNAATINYHFENVIKSTTDSDGNPGYSDINHTANYTLGNDATYVERTTNNEMYSINLYTGEMVLSETSETTKVWYYVEDGATKAIEEKKNNVSGEMDVQNVAASEDDMLGYYFAVSTLADGYGAEAILNALYAASQEATASGFEITKSDVENNAYAFKFTSTIINTTETSIGTVNNVNLFDVTVDFSYNDSYALTALNITCDAYTNDAGENSEADITLDYNAETGAVTKRENAIPNTFEFSVTQTVGERTYVHNKSIDEYIPTGFTFSNADGAVANGATIELSEGDDLELDIAWTPTTAYFDMIRNDISASMATADGATAAVSIQYRADGNPYLVAYQLGRGDYTLNVEYKGEVIYSITVNVAEPVVEGTYITVTVTETYSFYDVATLTAEASGTYTFTIPAGYGAWDKEESDTNPWGSAPAVDPNLQPDGGTISADIAAGESYSFYFFAPNKGEYKIAYTFVAKDVAGSGSEGGDEGSSTTVLKDANGLGGEYTFNFVMDYTLVFTVDSEGATAGTLEVTDPINSQYSGTYIYSIVDGAYVFTSENVTITNDGTAWLFKNPGMSVAKAFAEATAVESGDLVDANGLGGEYTFSFVMTFTLTFTPATAGSTYGTVTLVDPITSSYSGNYDYEIVDGEYVFADSSISVTNDGTNWYWKHAGLGSAQAFATYVAPEGGSEEGGNEEGGASGEYDTMIVEGANTLYFSADEVSANTATRKLTITNAGSYQFAAGNLFISAITAADGSAIAKNDDYTYTLAAGEYTVTFGMLSMFGVTADTACELNVVIPE